MSTCTEEGCGDKVLARGFCGRHYRRHRYHGRLAGLRECKIDGCTRPVQGQNLCLKHYAAARAVGVLAGPRCKIKNCARVRSGLHGYCYLHVRRKGRGTSMRTPIRKYAPGGTCSIELCGRGAVARGLCQAHWGRWSNGRDLNSPIRPINRLGRTGRILTAHGYVQVYEPSHPNANATGYVLEHRKAMSDSLGRPLLPSEEVHHKNGAHDDNRLVKGHELRCHGTCCNLELWSKSHPAGQRVEDKVAWAKEILRLYAE